MIGVLMPPELIAAQVDAYAQIYGYDDYLVTIDLDGEVVTEILLCENDELAWANDWWEGQDNVKLLGFIPVSHIKVFALSVEIGRPVFSPNSVRVHMTSIGKYRLEVIQDGQT